jgi:hypothetical protein
MIEIFNKFLVGSSGRGVVIQRPPVGTITADDALLLAAYLVTMAEHEASHEFSEVLAAVQGS